jgi:cystathionine gamma-lyase
LETARWLEKHPKVSAVLLPGLEGHPRHDLALGQARGFRGRFSFRLRGGEDGIKQVLTRSRVFTLAESPGGVESLIEHPSTMRHASVASEFQLPMGITPEPIRISVGFEDVGDLFADLDAAHVT